MTLILFINMKVYAYENNYIDVKIDQVNKGSTIELYSENGFKITTVRDKDYEQYTSRDRNIKLHLNYDDIEVHDLSGYLCTLEEDYIISDIDGEEVPIQINGKKYRGNLKVLDKGSRYFLINHILLDHYLYGVLPREIQVSAHREALKTQALVSKSFTIANLGKHKNEGFDLCNTTHCQVYGGYSVENDNTNRAISDVKGEFIYYNDKIINSTFHSNSGGRTESSLHVWGGDTPYLVGVEDSFSENTRNSTWEMSLTLKELESKLRSAGVNVGQLKEIEIVSKSPSGRVKEMDIIGVSDTKTISGAKFRAALGNTYLKSTLFTINSEEIENVKENNIYVLNGYGESDKLNTSESVAMDYFGEKKDIYGNEAVESFSDYIYLDIDASKPIKRPNNLDGEIIIYGKGYGHGVGLSQAGAMNMAEQGYDYKDIIKHYYRGVEIY